MQKGAGSARGKVQRQHREGGSQEGSARGRAREEGGSQGGPGREHARVVLLWLELLVFSDC
jgi:hypothetical protein